MSAEMEDPKESIGNQDSMVEYEQIQRVPPVPLTDRRLPFRVYGIPQTKGSTKAFMRKGMRFPVIVNDNTKNAGWAETVRGEAQRARNASGLSAPWGGPISLTLTFHMRKPKSHLKRAILHTKKPDLDKMLRSVKDALTGVIYLDDSQVAILCAQKLYSDSPGVEVLVRELL